MNYKAEIGDKVRFHFSDNISSVFGDLLYIPQATGDCWIIQTYCEGEKSLICYIQQFETMFILP